MVCFSSLHTEADCSTPGRSTETSLPTGLQATLATIISNMNTIMKMLKALQSGRRGGNPAEDSDERMRGVLWEPLGTVEELEE